jgi:hypothetical protein
MKPSNNLVKELELLINNGLKDAYLPYQKGNSIRIGHMIVRLNKKGFYLVYDSKTNSQVAKTFCKSSAIAIAKKRAQGQDVTSAVLNIDKVIQKHYNDAVFFKYTMKVTKDDLKRDVVSTRYQIAKDRTAHARGQLDKFIFS